PQLGDPPAELLREAPPLAPDTPPPKPAVAQPLAFEVPVTTESLIRRHPPRRLKRLEDQQLPLTHQLLDEKQAEAEQRRHQILTQRVQSAQQRYPKRNFQGY
ncbi:uncharacterized protein CCDC198-like, partial [Schistocerca gregaria]|uniref:uncharacterized protein CCDC198-like n=1 Tax=Schistocerca gregaria TaxID=7010 RepID=UPI00211E0760